MILSHFKPCVPLKVLPYTICNNGNWISFCTIQYGT